MLTNAQTSEKVVELGIIKASYPFCKTLLLGFMGGIYIALGAYANGLANFAIGGGMGRLVGAGLFPVGLMLTIMVGGSLFTGDALGGLALSLKKTKLRHYLIGLLVVWLGNFYGAALIAFLTKEAGCYQDSQFAYHMVHVAEHKLHLSATEAICSGFLCNILVAIAVWFALATKSLSGKVLAIWFPITLFVLAGFQHVVANMYYINLGLMLDADIWNASSYALHFLWVTVGNFISGGLFLPLIYKQIYLHH